MTTAAHPRPRWSTDRSGTILGTLGLVSWAVCLFALLSSSALDHQKDIGPYLFLGEITLLTVLGFTASAFAAPFRSWSGSVTLAASGALATLVALGWWTIGLGILPSAMFFLAAGVLLSSRRPAGVAVPVGAFLVGIVTQCLITLAIHAAMRS